MIGVRVSKAQREAITAFAADHGLRPATLARMLTLDVVQGETPVPEWVGRTARVRQTFAPEQLALTNELNRVGVNLNQAVRGLRSFGLAYDDEILESVLQTRAVLEQILGRTPPGGVA